MKQTTLNQFWLGWHKSASLQWFVIKDKFKKNVSNGLKDLDLFADMDPHTDTWVPNVINILTAITCEAPLTPRYGTMSPSKDIYYFGSSITFSCEEGYDLEGKSRLRCREDSTAFFLGGGGAWDADPPTCRGKTYQDPRLTTSVVGTMLSHFQLLCVETLGYLSLARKTAHSIFTPTMWVSVALLAIHYKGKAKFIVTRVESGHLLLPAALVSPKYLEFYYGNTWHGFWQLVQLEPTRKTHNLTRLVNPALPILTPHLQEAQTELNAFVNLVSRKTPMENAKVSDQVSPVFEGHFSSWFTHLVVHDDVSSFIYLCVIMWINEPWIQLTHLLSNPISTKSIHYYDIVHLHAHHVTDIGIYT